MLLFKELPAAALAAAGNKHTRAARVKHTAKIKTVSSKAPHRFVDSPCLQKILSYFTRNYH